jgi:cysteine desulfurase
LRSRLEGLGEPTGHPSERLPGIVSFTFEGIGGESLVMLLEARGVCASTGAACRSEKAQPSHVLRAMGRVARGSLRLSLGPATTREEVERAAVLVVECVEELRRRSCTPSR